MAEQVTILVSLLCIATEFVYCAIVPKNQMIMLEW